MAFFLAACAAVASQGSTVASFGELAGDGDRVWVTASLGVLVLLTLPVLVLLALAFAAAMLQLSLGLANSDLSYRRCFRAVLVGSAPLAARNVVLGIVIVLIGTGAAVQLIQYGDPFVMAAAALLFFHLRAVEGVARSSAAFGCFFTLGFPLALQIVLGLVTS